MKVLYFHQHFSTPRGASGTRSYEFARALIARGHQVTMVCGTNQLARFGLSAVSGKNYARGEVDGIDVIALTVPYSNRDGIAKRALVFAKFALRSVRIALSEKYDLIFATSTPLTVVVPGILAKLLRRKPFVFEVRDLWPELPKALGMKNPFLLAAMSLLEWLGYRTADGLVGLSPGIVDGIKKRAPQKTPVTMIPNGCDLDLFDPKQRSQLKIEGIGDGDFVAGFTGAHGIANGLEAILAAAAVLKKRGIAHIKFLFVGDGNQKDKIVEQAKAQGLDNCIFLPPVPKTELVKITSSLDCGLMVLKNIPAFYYGTSPNKFFDYIASGIPVLNNYPGWLAEMITENNCGVVVTPDDAEEFATKLEELAGDRQVARVMGQNAHHLAEKNFSREKLSREFCEFLEHNLA